MPSAEPTAAKPYTILVVAHPSGDWSIVSHRQTPDEIDRLRTAAAERGCRLVRYPLEAFRLNEVVDFALAEEVPDGGEPKPAGPTPPAADPEPKPPMPRPFCLLLSKLDAAAVHYERNGHENTAAMAAQAAAEIRSLRDDVERLRREADGR
jgi:hypothetical protein